MNKKLFLVLAVLIALVFAFTACSGGGYDNTDGESGGGRQGESNSGGDSQSGDETSGDIDFVSARKIIYNVKFSLTADDIGQARKLIRNSIKKDSGEWFDVENDYQGRSYFVARILNDRLDEFVDAVSANGQRDDYSKTATDISLNYADKKNQIELLEAQRTAYQKILADAKNISDIMTITAEINRIIQQINNLNSDLNKYDSMVEYSAVTINLYEKYVPAEQPEKSFGQQLGEAFEGGGKAVLVFFQGILLILGYTWPFLIIIGGIITGLCFLSKANKKKRMEQYRQADQRRNSQGGNNGGVK